VRPTNPFEPIRHIASLARNWPLRWPNLAGWTTRRRSVSFTGGPSVTIKSHHNVGGLPVRMNMKLVDPLREFFKDEVS
jgi:hypothetical protein